jgi:RHS repeat-associated protein
VTQYEYDVQDHLKKVTDGEGNITTYETGDRDLMTKETSPVFSGATPFRTFVYNAHGALVTETDPRGIVTSRTVDDLDRVTLIDYADNTLDTSFTYDGLANLFQKGRLVSINRGAGASVVSYGYDRFGRMLQDGALAYEYDKNGNRTKITIPGGVVADYTHDLADREASLIVTGGGLGATTIASGAVYKPSGPLSSLLLGNGVAETRSFDARYYPDQIQAGALLNWDYTVDRVGNPTGISGSVVPGVSDTPAFAYQDHQYFLTQTNSGPWGSRTWTYDKIGNRLSFARTSEPTQTYAYASPGHNPKLSTITPAPGWGTGNWTFGYDAAGNQISIAESDNEGAVQSTLYDFAGDSRLSALRTASPVGPARTDNLYDGRGFLRESLLTVTGSVDDEIRVTPLYSSAGVLMARTEARKWIGGDPNPAAEDQPWAWTQSETTQLFYFAGRPVAQLTTGPELLYITTDHLGTPALVTDPAGAAIWAGGLEPFGSIWTAGTDRPDLEPASGGGSSVRSLFAPAVQRLSAEKVFLRYPGQWSNDAFRVGAAQGEVYYNVNRWYAPVTGRYERPDPASTFLTLQNIDVRSLRAMTFGSARPLMLYSYALGNPAQFSDSLGLAPCRRDPAVASCDLESNCCVAACLDTARYGLCVWRGFDQAGDAIEALAGGAVGAGIGVALRGGFVGAGIGFCSGAGLTLLVDSLADAEERAAVNGIWLVYRDCVQGCGQQCGPGRICNDAFDQIVEGD